MNQLFDNLLEPIQDNSDYYDPVTGLMYCGKCRTPKEAFFENGLTLNGRNKHPTECHCSAQRRMEQEAVEGERKRQDYLHLLRMDAFRDIPGCTWRFENTEVETTPLCIARNYANHWEEMLETHSGLILFGNVGTGKTYAAGCIANAVIDKCVSVGFFAVSDLVNRMQGLWGDDRERLMQSLMKPDLLILDDLGAERKTTYGKECVFEIFNRRYLSMKPMIVTTNISLKYMMEAEDMDERRIFDRILERCTPVKFDCQNFRQRNRQENRAKVTRLLNAE